MMLSLRLLIGQGKKHRKSPALALIGKNREAFPVVIIEKKYQNESQSSTH